MRGPSEPRAGLVFRHARILDPDWEPGPGQKYADAPHALCRITAIRNSLVYYAVGAGARKGRIYIAAEAFPTIVEGA